MERSRQGYTMRWRIGLDPVTLCFWIVQGSSLLRFHPLIRSCARICGREWSLVFGLERRVTSLLKRGRSGNEMGCLTSYLLLGKSTALGLSCSVGESAVMMPISTAEMG